MNEIGTENDEIAEIYQKMVHGDKNALAHLQRVQKSPPKSKKSIILKPQEQKKDNEPKTSIQLNRVRKSQNFQSYVKEKVAQFRTVKQNSKKQLLKSDKSTEKKQFHERKPFSIQKKKNEVTSDKKVPSESDKRVAAQTESKLPKPKSMVANVPKRKTANTFQQKINKNIIKDQPVKEQKLSPPSSKNSFRVRSVGGSKKLIEQLLRINEEQKILQGEIFELHNQTKKQIDQVLTKHKLTHLQKSRMTQVSNGSRNQMIQDPQIVLEPTSPQNNILSAIAEKSQFIKNQDDKIRILERQLVSLDKKLMQTKSSISKKQAKIQMSALNTYVSIVPDIFEQQRQSEQQNQQVKELPSNKHVPLPQDPTKTYQTAMNQRKKKNWGLHTRINYEYDGNNMFVNNNRNQSKVSKSTDRVNDSPLRGNHKEDGENKVVVNSRLKQFLFQ